MIQATKKNVSFFFLLLFCFFCFPDRSNSGFARGEDRSKTSAYERTRVRSDNVPIEPRTNKKFASNERVLLQNSNNEEEEEEEAARRSVALARLRPKQIHLSITGDEEVSVIWTTEIPLNSNKYTTTDSNNNESMEENVVEYSCSSNEYDEMNREQSNKVKTWNKGIVYASESYTQQVCLAAAQSLLAPAMGEPRLPVEKEILVQLANTSSWADTDASNYRVVKEFKDVIPDEWFTMTNPWEKTVCLGYSNANGGWYRSPFIHKAKLYVTESSRKSSSGDFCVYNLPNDEDADGKKVYRTFKKRSGGSSSSSSSKTNNNNNNNDEEEEKTTTTIIAVVGDTGQTDVTKKVFQHIKDIVKPNVLIHTGDVSYADGFPARWDSFGELSEELFSSVPVVIASGNHDVVNNGAEYTAFEKRYETPWKRSGSYSKNFWSFNVDKAHVLHIDSYSSVSTQMFDGAVADTFQTWLEDDLARVNRKKTPWIIAVFHAPWYNSNEAHYKENELQRLKYEQILYKFGVDVALNGHVHSYERSHPVYNNQRNACGITHIVIGDGGNYEGPYGSGWMIHPQPSWSAFREGSFGSGSLILHNDTHMTWKWERNACVHPDGKTDMNHTYWKMTDGESALDCRTDPDTSENAMVAVDTFVFVKDDINCENRKMGTGVGGEKVTFVDEISATTITTTNVNEKYRIQSLTVALILSLFCLTGLSVALWKMTKALKRAKFAVSVHSAHMMNRGELGEGMEILNSSSRLSDDDDDDDIDSRGDEMLLFAKEEQRS
jgi:acid phosphatase type 7